MLCYQIGTLILSSDKTWAQAAIWEHVTLTVTPFVAQLSLLVSDICLFSTMLWPDLEVLL